MHKTGNIEAYRLIVTDLSDFGRLIYQGYFLRHDDAFNKGLELREKYHKDPDNEGCQCSVEITTIIIQD